MHLTLLHFDLEATGRVDAFRLFFVDVRLIVFQLLALIQGCLEKSIECAAKLDGRSELLDEGVTALETIELLQELSL